MPAQRGVYDKGGLHQVVVNIPGATIAADATWSLFVAPCALELTAISETFDAGVTGNATHYFTHEYRNEGLGGAGTTAVAVLKEYLASVDATAHVPVPITLSTTVANRRLAVGEVLSLVRLTPGNGLAEPTGLVTIQFKPL